MLRSFRPNDLSLDITQNPAVLEGLVVVMPSQAGACSYHRRAVER